MEVRSGSPRCSKRTLSEAGTRVSREAPGSRPIAISKSLHKRTLLSIFVLQIGMGVLDGGHGNSGFLSDTLSLIETTVRVEWRRSAFSDLFICVCTFHHELLKNTRDSRETINYVKAGYENCNHYYVKFYFYQRQFDFIVLKVNK